MFFQLQATLLITVSLLPNLASALPTPFTGLERRLKGRQFFENLFGLGGDDEAAIASTVTPLSAVDVTSQLLRPAFFARTSYCSSENVTAWTCGAPCEATPGVKILQAGGDDGLIPMYFIAFDPEEQQIVVAHQGTSRNSILSIANNLQILQVDLDTSRFPGAGEGVKVHDGFQKTFARTADEVLDGVQAGLTAMGVNKVLITGHSLGAAVASMDAVMLRANLAPEVQITTTVFAMPRVGNQEWADLTDRLLGSTFTHVTNQNDIVPNIPPQFLDYVHAGGEVFITPGTDTAITIQGSANTGIVRCAGQENEGCINGNSLLDVSIGDHGGPYFNNIKFGSSACPL